MNMDTLCKSDMENYRKKVLGAWLGKAVGGTLGQPWEGSRGPLALSFYDPVPTDMMPNDDIDLQVVWACRLATDWQGVVSYANFSDAWLRNIGFSFDEYGVARRNLARGIPAPHSGAFDNAFTDGMGAAIRAEIWAVLGAVKTQFGKFGDLLAATKKKLEESANKIGAAEVTSRQIERKLKDVETLPDTEAKKLIGDIDLS